MSIDADTPVATLLIELDAAWEYGAQQADAALLYKSATMRDAWNLKKHYPYASFARAVGSALARYDDVENYSAEAALEAIRDDLVSCNRNHDIIEEEANKAADK